MTRPPYQSRTLLITSELMRESAIQLIRNLPLDLIKPIQVKIGEQSKSRLLTQNALMWSGPLADIALQGWIEGQQFTDKAWHHFFKMEFLPEEYDPLLTLDGYVKWEITPKGDKALIGSTTDLTIKGFAEYLEQVYAFGAGLGVQFTADMRGR